MKVLFINVVCGIKSTGRIVTDLAQKYMDEGHEVKIAYGRENVPEKYKSVSYRIGKDKDIIINALKARLFDNEGFNAAKQTESFIEWANSYDPDVLWLHNLHGYYLNIEQIFKWIKSRSHMEVRWTLHDCWAFTGHCSHFCMVECEKWKRQCQNCSQIKAYPSSLCRDRSALNYQQKKELFCGVKNMKIITPSYWLASLVKQSFLKEYQVMVINNKIDHHVFKPTKGDFRIQNGLQDKKIVLGVASCWIKEKGLEDFVNLASMLDDRFKIVLVGVSPKQKKELSPLVLGIEKTDSSKQLAEIYTAANVFVNLSYQESYPTVNLEAQACGTVCLTYATGGAPETVSTEFVVEQGNLIEMADKIKKVCLEGKL